MKSLQIADATLCQACPYTFKDKLRLARTLDELQVDYIEFPALEGSKQDALLLRTVASSLTFSRISLGVNSPASLAVAKELLAICKGGKARLEVYTSPVGMEYLGRKKAPQMLAWIKQAVTELADYDVEFVALDATRAESAFLADAIATACEAGAKSVCLCDSAAIAMPDTFASFVSRIAANTSLAVGIACSDQNGMALANAFVALKAGCASFVKTTVEQETVGLEALGNLLHNCGLNEGLSCSLDFTHLHHTLAAWRASEDVQRTANEDNSIRLDKEDSAETVKAAVEKIGYELSDDDHALVYEEFLRVADKKSVGAKELDAIVASSAMQVPPLYKVESFVVNNSNLFSSSAQVTLSREGVQLQGIRFADGPIAAAFLALEEIIGQHYELDDFQILAVTEGQGAMGKAMVKLRHDGKLYSGTGLSTDIIGAAIRAWVNAVNKIAYEEA